MIRLVPGNTRTATAAPCPWAAIRAMVPSILHERRGSAHDSGVIYDRTAALAICRNLYPGDPRWARVAHGMLLSTMQDELRSMGILSELDVRLLNALEEVGSAGHEFRNGEWLRELASEEIREAL